MLWDARAIPPLAEKSYTSWFSRVSFLLGEDGQEDREASVRKDMVAYRSYGIQLLVNERVDGENFSNDLDDRGSGRDRLRYRQAMATQL